MQDGATESIGIHELAAVAEALPDAVVVIDPRAVVRWANLAAERLMGRPRSAWMGSNGLELVHPDDLGLATLSLASVQDKQVGTPIELRLAGADGWQLVELVGAPLDGDHLVLSLRDVTQRRRWEVAGDETARFRSLVHNAAGITMLLRADGSLESVSGAVTRRLGLDPEVICGQPLAAIVAPDDRPTLAVALHEAAAATDATPSTAEVRLLRAGGAAVPFELSIVSLLDDPTVEGYVVSAHDITRLRAAQEELEQLATYDALTGLFNRRVFDAALTREWTMTQRDGIDSYVVVADLDGFKGLNDEHGHGAGDAALREFGFILRSLVRDTDLVARRGGDEFAVLLVRCGGEPAALGLTARLHEEMAKRCWPGATSLTVSVGHQSLRRSDSPDDAIDRADRSMLEHKSPH